MIKSISKKVLTVIMVLMLIMSVVPFGTFAATTITLLDGQITVTDTQTSSMSESGGVVTVTAKGGLLSQKTNTVTITNSSLSTATVSFNYSASNYKSFSESTASGTKSVLLDVGGKVTLSITGKAALSSNTATLTLSNFSIAAASDNSTVTVVYDSNYGSVTVDGNAVASGASADVALSGATFTATVSNGATFGGWINSATGQILSADATATLAIASDMTVKAAFIVNGGTAYFKVDADYLFDDLNKAATCAATYATTAVLMNNATLPSGDYTIPAGATLLIPFDSANTLYTTKPASVRSDGYTTPSVYRTLTMASGAEITVNGSISLPSMHSTAQGSRIGSVNTGAYGHISMAEGSNITLNNGAYLYAWGYITGNGTVTANSGANLYEYFQFRDFRGGTQTTDMQNEVFPFSQYYVQNIEAPLTLYAGAKENTYATVTMSDTDIATPITFIGSSDAMFTLSSGSLTKRYDGTTDRLVIESDGNISVSPITIQIKADGLAGILVNKSIDTSDYELPITNNITLHVNSGTVSINQDVAFLPGAEVIIKENAQCVLGSGNNVYVYDADQWGNFCYGNLNLNEVNKGGNSPFYALPYAPGRTYTRTKADLVDAKIQVDGVVDASNGYVYTTAGGANICSTGTGKVIANAGTQTVTYQLVQGTGYTSIAITPAKVKNANGTYTQTYTDTYNYSNGSWEGECVHSSYSDVVTAPTCTAQGYTTHTCASCGCVWADTYVPVIDHTYTAVTTDPTCTAQGYTTHTCTACGHAYVDNYVPVIDHTYTAATTDPTCTVAGSVVYTCNCGASYTETIPATGHDYNSETTTNPGCESVGKTTHTCANCGDTYTTDIEATGHNYSSSVTTEPGCETAGVMTYTCANCGNSYTEEIAAIGHSYSSSVTTEPDCENEGVLTHTCSNCGDSYTTAIEALGHKYTSVVTAPTCTEQGYTTHTCSVCGDVKVDSYVEALGHKYTSVVTAPTCTEQGYTTHTCSVCDDVKVDTYVDATGHSYGDWIVRTEPTCDTEGEQYKTCSCGHEETQTIAALGHDYNEEFTVDKEASHTEDGSKSRHCATCGSKTDVTVILAIVCDINNDGAVDAFELTRIRKIILGSITADETDKVLFDMNDDGIINILDMISLKKYIAKNA